MILLPKHNWVCGWCFPLRIWLWTALVILSASTQAEIALPPHPRAATSWAADHLRAAATAAFGKQTEIAVGLERKLAPKLAAESFNIRPDGSRLVIEASDPNGELYGLLELAEQVTMAKPGQDWTTFVSQYQAIRKQRSVAFRADNPFIHIERTKTAAFAEKFHLRKPPLLFEDMGMWKQYIDMLAESRFNVLDLHGVYNVATTTFHNVLPFLVAVPGYSGAGDPKIEARNLADLRHLISYANKRGVKVALMNYSTKVDGIHDDALRDYTAKAVGILLRELPKLKMFGFRVGESGEYAKFFRDAYIDGVRQSGRKDVRLYTRSWKTTPDELDALAASFNGMLDVEIKYNGEHLGLPYQAIQGPSNANYSYGDFLQSGTHYERIWQIRANGTHRFWMWADTEFIRRTVGTMAFGEASGFSLEPQIAYFSTAPSMYFRSREDQQVYRYMWQKYWPWYFAWGRIAYDATLPEATLVNAYQKHFGPEGAKVYGCLQASGKIVPMAFAYRFVGPDQRNTSPETQTGAFDTSRHEPVAPLSFARNSPMDQRSFAGIDEFVREKIAEKSDSRAGPATVAKYLDNAASATAQNLAGIDRSLDQNPEWRVMKADIASTAWLGKYHAERITGTMHLDYALLTGSPADYAIALDHLSESRKAWGALAQTADAIYAPLQNPLIGQTNFRWRSESSRLEALDAAIPALWAAAQKKKSAPPLVLTSTEAGDPPGLAISDLHHELLHDSAHISCRFNPPDSVQSATVWAKDFPSESEWRATPMVAESGDSYSAAIPVSREGLLYTIAIRIKGGSAAQFPSPFVATPYWTIPAREVSGTAPSNTSTATQEFR